MAMYALLSASCAFMTPPVAQRLAVSPRASTTTMAAGGVPTKNVWTTFASAADCKPGTINSGFQAGQEVAICNADGKLYGISNKLPPTGQPSTLGSLEKLNGKTVIVEPLSGTCFDLSTGKHVGPWCPSVIGRFLLGKIVGPEVVPTFQVRKSGDKIQALINVNLKAQFEQKYWRGVLDAQGKVDGGYY